MLLSRKKEADRNLQEPELVAASVQTLSALNAAVGWVSCKPGRLP